MTLAWEISASHNFIPLTDKNLSKLVQISAAVPIMLKSPNCAVLNTLEVQQAQECSHSTAYIERSELWTKVFEKSAGVFIRAPYMQGQSPSYVN